MLKSNCYSLQPWCSHPYLTSMPSELCDHRKMRCFSRHLCPCTEVSFCAIASFRSGIWESIPNKTIDSDNCGSFRGWDAECRLLLNCKSSNSYWFSGTPPVTHCHRSPWTSQMRFLPRCYKKLLRI